MQGLLKLFKRRPMQPVLSDFDPVIRQVTEPDHVVIPLDYPAQVRYLPTVEIGQTVRKGQVIGTSRVGNSVCASISGTIRDITTVWTAQSHHSVAVVIDRNNADEAAADIFDGPVTAGDQMVALNRLRAAGIAPPYAMSGREYGDGDIAELPRVETVIITGIRQESTIVTSQLLLEQQPEKVAEGLKWLTTVFPEARICLTAPEQFRPWATNTFADVAEMVYLPTSYRGRLEREVVSRILGRRIPSRKSYRFMGIAVLDVEYLLAMVDAFAGTSALTQKCLTISGTDIETAITVRFPLGSSIEHVLASQGLDVSGYGRHVVGGPMMGVAQFSDKTPLTYSSGIYLIKGDAAPADTLAPCINCGRCARVCPVNIQVHLVNRMIEFGQLEEAKKLHPEACHECGLCASVCPAERPIVQLFHFCNHEMVHGERFNWITGDNQ